MNKINFLIMGLFFSVSVYAGPGKGMGNIGHGGANVGNFTTNSSAMPPGLQKRGQLPKGLQMQQTTPPGWSHGKKVGWKKHHIKKSNVLNKNISNH